MRFKYSSSENNYLEDIKHSFAYFKFVLPNGDTYGLVVIGRRWKAGISYGI
jgi:hypothetical protein